MNNTLNVTLYVNRYTNTEQTKLIKLIRKTHKSANKSCNVQRYAANN